MSSARGPGEFEEHGFAARELRAASLHAANWLIHGHGAEPCSSGRSFDGARKPLEKRHLRP